MDSAPRSSIAKLAKADMNEIGLFISRSLTGMPPM
jgi:hypothetical protein